MGIEVLDELLIVLTGEFGCLPTVSAGDRQMLLTDAIRLYLLKRDEYEAEFTHRDNIYN